MKSRAEKLAEHMQRKSKMVRATWPLWKQVLLRPRKPRNGFKV